jgi:hypothetical protein
MRDIITRTVGKIRNCSQDSAEFPVDLYYDIENPHAVSIGFYTGGPKPVVWTMGAALFFNTAVTHSVPVGEQCATVTFDLMRDEVRLFLRAERKEVTVILYASAIANFITEVRQRTTREVEAAARESLAARFSHYLQTQ